MSDIQLTQKQLYDFLTLVAIPNGYPILITGAPGTGKTDLATKAAHYCQNDFMSLHPVVSDPTDFKGIPGIIPATADSPASAEFFPTTELRRLMTATRPLVCLIDDIGQAPAATQAAVMQLLLARQINGHKISDNVTFLAATNRRQDRAGVTGILEPVKSRFYSIVELVVNPDDWCRWALQQPNFPVEVIQFIRFRPAMLHDFQPSADLVNTPSPRTVHNVARLLTAGLPKDLEYPVIAGAAGSAFASEFLSFLKIFRTLPNPDAVLLDPKNHEMPTDPATLYALTGALARKATPNNFDSLTTIADRLTNELSAHGGAEFSVVLVKDCLEITTPRDENGNAKGPSPLTATKAFIQWATNHADLLL